MDDFEEIAMRMVHDLGPLRAYPEYLCTVYLVHGAGTMFEFTAEIDDASQFLTQIADAITNRPDTTMQVEDTSGTLHCIKFGYITHITMMKEDEHE